MRNNLALYLITYIMHHMSLYAVGEVCLSEFKRMYAIPPATFHRHINSLLDEKVIIRVKRDTYALHPKFCTYVKNIAEDFQPKMSPVRIEFSGEIPF